VEAFEDSVLLVCAAALDDIEKVRIATQNRVRDLTRDEPDKDGEQRGLGLNADVPEVARMQAIADGLAALEHDAELTLKRALRGHPLHTWIAGQRGIGEKQAARLLAAVGDPYVDDRTGQPRTVSALWKYCGYDVRDGAAPRRRKGQKSNWNAEARMRTRLVAESIVKAGGPWREIYDKARVLYDGAVHDRPCVQCGPSGKPAPEGSPLSAGHQHARALRKVAKEVLRGMWRASRDLHT
jgi:hypothetical protein